MAKFLSAFRNAAAALATAALAACSATGGPFGLSEEQAQALGEQQHPQIVAAFGGELDDPATTAYAERVFERLMAGSAQPGAQIEFTVLDSPVINAMALPGHVYVTRGLLALANSEAELAGVIGHEIGHVFERHTAQRVSRGNLAQLGAIGAAILTGDEDVAQIAGAAGQLYLLKFSRSQEYEADQVGVRLLARANYDPLAEADFLDTLGRWSALESQIAGVEAPPEYLSTHPNSADRVERAAREADVLRAAGAGAAERNRAAYLQAIDGLLYGDDPVKQGFIEGDTFIHPEIGIAFSVPSGFELRNTPQAVLARGPSGAQMQFSAGSSDEPPAAIINGPISQSLGLDLSPARSIEINGRPAAVGQARANTQSGPVDVAAYAIRWEGNMNYIFLWVAPSGVARQLERPIAQSVQSLRAIDRAAIDIPEPRRVDVVTAQAGDTVNELSQAMAFPSHRQDRFLIFNSLDPNATLDAGRAVKLVR